MKTNLVVIFLTLLMVAACESNVEKQLPISGEIVTEPVCNNGLKSTTIIENLPDSLFCLQYEYDVDNNYLSLVHQNVFFSCCATINCAFELEGDTIFIYEVGEYGMACNCVCYYDLELGVENILSKEYVLKIKEAYRKPIIFNIDLENENKGEYCDLRSLYYN